MKLHKQIGFEFEVFKNKSLECGLKTAANDLRDSAIFFALFINKKKVRCHDL